MYDLVADRGVVGGVVQGEHTAPAIWPRSGEAGGVDWVSGPGGGVKRFRLNRKTPAHIVSHGLLGGSVSATC